MLRKSDTTLYTADSTLRAFDLETGEQLWSVERDREPDEQGLVSQNRIFYATNPGYLTAHDLTSISKDWEVRVDHSITSQPAATESVVFVGDSNGNYSGIDIETVKSYTTAPKLQARSDLQDLMT